MRSFLLLVVVSAFASLGKGEHFCYEDDSCGPRTWGSYCKSGSQQSPIDIPVTVQDLKGAQSAEIIFDGDYSKSQDFILTNNGHTLQASIQSDLTSTSFLHGSLLGDKEYRFSQLHFHWGSNDSQGSEHTINNRSFPIEGHFVHYSSEYNSLSEAIKSQQPNALTVVGVIYMISPKDNPAFTPLLKAITEAKNSGNTANGTGLNLVKLLPRFPDIYNFQYDGSLTTPTCDQVVLWNVLGAEGRISRAQLNKFRKAMDGNKKNLQNNFRPTQALNGRKIRTFKTKIAQ